MRRGRLKDEDEVSAFPRKRAYLLGLCLYVNGFSASMVLPFAPMMTAHFFPDLNNEQLGYEAGFLSSSYFMGAFFGSILWGWVSDAYGRRVALLCGICGTLLSVCLFGFSTSFAMANTARFMWGLLNGNIGVAKTYMSEICDDSTQARGMALIAAQGGLGRLTGPAAGGLLAEPARQYPALADIELLTVYPFVAPCLVGALLAAVSFVGAFAWLQETLPVDKRLTSSPADGLRHCLGRVAARGRRQHLQGAKRERGALTGGGRPAVLSASAGFARLAGESSVEESCGDGTPQHAYAHTDTYTCCRQVRHAPTLSVALYVLTGFYQIGLQVCFHGDFDRWDPMSPDGAQ